MNREEIIKLAREAGICISNSILLPAPDGEVEALERFAALVAAHEREECIKIAKTWYDNCVMEARTVAKNIADEIARSEK